MLRGQKRKNGSLLSQSKLYCISKNEFKSIKEDDMRVDFEIGLFLPYILPN